LFNIIAQRSAIKMVYKRYAYKKEKGVYLPKKKGKMNIIKENISLKRMKHPGIEVVVYGYKLMGKS